MPSYTLADLAHLLGGELVGDPGLRIEGVAPLDAAGPSDLSLVAKRKYAAYVPQTRAAAVIVARGMADELAGTLAQIRVADPHVALRQVLTLLYPATRPPAGIHPTAVIGPDVELGEEVAIGAYAVVGSGSRIGARAQIGAHVVLGEQCVIGADSVLHPQVTLYAGTELGERCVVHSGARLGVDGFGFVWLDGAHTKIPQVGGCRIGADVEIGANTTIDRGSIGDTVVGRGSKLDNLVQLGHNVRLGDHVILISQVGIAGSTSVGDGAVLGGQVGVAGHLAIGAGARVGAQAGVTADVGAGETVSGYPARPHREALRAQAALFRLPALWRRLQQLERLVFGGAAPAAGKSDPSDTSA